MSELPTKKEARRKLAEKMDAKPTVEMTFVELVDRWEKAVGRAAPSAILPASKLRVSRFSSALARRVRDVERHMVQCSLCQHPQREEIEHDFIVSRSA